MVSSKPLYIVLISIILLSGCQEAGPGGGPGTAEMEYEISYGVESTEDISDNVTILNESNSTINESDTLQRYLESAVAENSTRHRDQINESEFENLREAFQSVPAYDAGERATVPDSGSYSRSVYIYRDGVVVRISLFAIRPG